MDPLTQVRGRALGSQGALTNNIGARPPADLALEALSDETQPIQDTTELSPEAQRELQASSAGSSGRFAAGVKQIVRDLELIDIKYARKDPNSAASIGVRECNEITQILSNMSVSERQRVFRHLFMGGPGAPIDNDPLHPNESKTKERLLYRRARAKELLDGTGQEGTRAATAASNGTQNI